MKRFEFASFVLVVAGAVSCSSTSSMEAMDEQAMMAKMMEYGTPGEAHKVLDNSVGLWKVKATTFNPDGTPGMTSDGSSEIKWMMDGRFLHETFTGDFGGMPFHGTGVVGFDNIKQRYVGTWIDNMSTGVMTMEGKYDPKARTMSMESEMPNPMTWSYVDSKMVTTWIDDDHSVAKFYMPGPDGKNYMHMQLEYTRTSP